MNKEVKDQDLPEIIKQSLLQTMSKTLFDKVWDAHVVKRIKNGPDVLFIDRHLVHEVTSPVAFLGLQNRKLDVLFP